MPIEADDRIAQRYHERLVRDERARGKHGVAKAERMPLPRVEVLHRGPLELERGEQFLFAMLPKQLDELFIHVEMILERGFAGTGDEEDAPKAGLGQLFADVLHDRLAADGQHFLRL